MTLRSDSRSRPRTRTRIRTARRLSPCYRHPDEPLTGICPSCLRERLSGLDASSSGGGGAGDAAPELRRCRSVSKVEGSSNSIAEPRRNSCDVVSGRSSLSNLFDVDDVKIGSDVDSRVESKNLGLSRVTYTIVESEDRDGEIRVRDDKLGVKKEDAVEIDDGEFRTMKEYIDLEFQNKSKKSKDLKVSFWGAASVFSKKLKKWGQKSSSDKTKKLGSCSDGKSLDGGDANLKLFTGGGRLEGTSSEIVGRRSCDMEPRFSVDAGRISIEEPRASWDGYMIARTIPRLAPMFSVVENGNLKNINSFENHRLSVDGPMHPIVEDESSSGVSGNSDSSSSMRRSSFDRSSSVQSCGKKPLSSEDHGLSPANVKLVITEKELKDWRLSSNRTEAMEKFGSIPRDSSGVDVGNSDMPPRKSVTWRKVRNVFSFKTRNSENKSEAFQGYADEPSIDAINGKQGREAGGHVIDINGWNLTRSSSVVGSRKACDGVGSTYRRRSIDNAVGWAFKGMEEFAPEIKRSADRASTELEDGMTPFYMTPLRSLRRSKSGKFKLQNSHSIAGNILRLN